MDDQAVHVENSLRMLSALRRHHVYAEAHLFPHGPHGMATADKTIAGDEAIYENARIAEWVELAAGFMRELK
jgi:endo-1,4-beta-xylanase